METDGNATSTTTSSRSSGAATATSPNKNNNDDNSEKEKCKPQKKIFFYCKTCDEFYPTKEILFYRNVLKKDSQYSSPSKEELSSKLSTVELPKELEKQMRNFSFLCEDGTFQQIVFTDEEDRCSNCGNREFIQFQNKTKTELSYFALFFQCKTSTCRKIYLNKLQYEEKHTEEKTVIEIKSKL